MIFETSFFIPGLNRYEGRGAESTFLEHRVSLGGASNRVNFC